MSKALKSGRRARDDSQKAERREAILEIARKLLGRKDLGALSMDEIASRARLAKGTLYLYFRTKEEVFLEIHLADYASWFGEFRQWLETEFHPALRSPESTARQLAAWVVGSLKRHERFAQLLPILGPVLEKNLSLEAALRFKQALALHIDAAALELDKKLNLKAGQGSRLLLRIHAMVVGASVQCTPPPVLEKLLESDPRFAPFRESLDQVLTELLEHYLHGFLLSFRL